MARVHALGDVLVLHELGKEAPDEGVTRPYRNVFLVVAEKEGSDTELEAPAVSIQPPREEMV